MLAGRFCFGFAFVDLDSEACSSAPQDVAIDRRMVEAVVVVRIFSVFFIIVYDLAAMGYRFNETHKDL